MAHELSRIIKNVAVQMKDRTIDGKDPVSFNTFPKDFNATCDACNTHEGSTLWLFKHFITGPVGAVINAPVTLPMQTAKNQKGCLMSNSVVVNFLLKWHATDNNIAVVDEVIRQFRQGALSAADYARQLWTKSLRCGSVYTNNVLKGLFVEGINRSICRALRQW